MKKKIPTFETDEEAERFTDTADLSEREADPAAAAASSDAAHSSFRQA